MAIAMACPARSITKSAPAERPSAFGEEAQSLRKAAHGALAKVSDAIEKLHFNVCVAHIYEFANAFGNSIGSLDNPQLIVYRIRPTRVRYMREWALEYHEVPIEPK